MRLIEADAVYKTLESCEIRKATIGNPLTDWEDGYTCGIERAESEIECAPTVEAIPIEWIKQFIKKENIHISNKVGIAYMVEQWKLHPIDFEISSEKCLAKMDERKEE